MACCFAQPVPGLGGSKPLLDALESLCTASGGFRTPQGSKLLICGSAGLLVEQTRRSHAQPARGIWGSAQPATLKIAHIGGPIRLPKSTVRIWG
eukprot:10915710-Lingulodinium_polyedra.AAC.1